MSTSTLAVIPADVGDEIDTATDDVPVAAETEPARRTSDLPLAVVPAMAAAHRRGIEAVRRYHAHAYLPS